MGVFSSKPAKPAPVPTDTIIPLHWQDDNSTFRAIVTTIMLRFDDVLDPEKLQTSLATLMEMGDWRKLGARLRMNESGKLEYHVPESFDAKRPAFKYTHVKYETSISEHSLASKLPRSTTRPTVLGSPDDFRSLSQDPDTPTKIDDYLFSDVGQLSLRIVSFNDAMLVSLTWPHTLMDAMGRRALLDAWISVLSGRKSEVPSLHGFDKDPLTTFGTQPSESYALANQLMKGFAFFTFSVRMAFELMWYSKDEHRVVCLPATHFNSMKSTALSELSTLCSEPEQKQFISDGDIICSWWARLALSMVPRNTKRNISLMNAYGLRTILSDLLPADKAYISNASNEVFTIFPAYVLFTHPVSYTASLIRRSIVEQSTRSQREALAALTRQSQASSGRSPMFGDGSTKLIVFSNWTKARFFELDFSAAVVKEGIPLEKRKHGLGRPSYMQSSAFTNGFPMRNAFPIYGKDAEGNYWFSGTLRTETWKTIEDEFTNKY
ncbi:Transcriptional regulator sdnM [Lachnellula suecica]|uniref:Transcriptional regulator sdnM n=1 Tax=Lachnellula suecica TaxID=602035 RepID=A0A8T9BYB2_9HELO|nr:Transcriptional regulator sdnM [Lachnellula suecica]